jgi:uncharacterized protein (DUF433 family)
MTKTAAILESNPGILGGGQVFAGTRVPVRNLIDYLAAGDTLEVFLSDFPSVSREQAQGALLLAGELLNASGGQTPAG